MPSDHRRVAEDDAGLERVRGVAAQHARRGRELDARSRRAAAASNPSSAHLDPRHDHAAQVLTLGRDAIEGGCGAEIDHDRSAP